MQNHVDTAPADEQLLTLTQIARELQPTWPVRANGTRPPVEAIYQMLRRRIIRGDRRNVQLEAQLYGKVWVVRRSAWQRFLEAEPLPSPKSLAAEARAQQNREERERRRVERERHRAACQRAAEAFFEESRRERAAERDRQRRERLVAAGISGVGQVPALKLHKASGRAYVRLPGGAFKYLGKWGTPAADDAYRRFAAEWQKSGMDAARGHKNPAASGSSPEPANRSESACG
jgi:hypothetical protein